MSAARLFGAFWPVLLLVIAVGGALWVLRQERRDPSSYTRRLGSLANWHSLSTREQRRADDAALDAAEEAETGRVRPRHEWRRWESDVVADAAEAAELTAAQAAEAAKRNALFHP